MLKAGEVTLSLFFRANLVYILEAMQDSVLHLVLDELKSLQKEDPLWVEFLIMLKYRNHRYFRLRRRIWPFITLLAGAVMALVIK